MISNEINQIQWRQTQHKCFWGSDDDYSRTQLPQSIKHKYVVGTCCIGKRRIPIVSTNDYWVAYSFTKILISNWPKEEQNPNGHHMAESVS